MIKQLIALATSLDSKGFTKEADILDGIIKKAPEPTAYFNFEEPEPQREGPTPITLSVDAGSESEKWIDLAPGQSVALTIESKGLSYLTMNIKYEGPQGSIRPLGTNIIRRSGMGDFEQFAPAPDGMTDGMQHYQFGLMNTSGEPTRVLAQAVMTDG